MELLRRFRAGGSGPCRSGRCGTHRDGRLKDALAWRREMVMPLGFPSDDEALRVSPCRPAWAPQSHHRALADGRAGSGADRPRAVRRLPASPSSSRWEAASGRDRLDAVTGEPVTIEARCRDRRRRGAQHGAERRRHRDGGSGRSRLISSGWSSWRVSTGAVGDRRHALYVLTASRRGGRGAGEARQRGSLGPVAESDRSAHRGWTTLTIGIGSSGWIRAGTGGHGPRG